MNTLDGSIAATLGTIAEASRPLGGGCIHDARCLDLADGRRVFVKSARGDQSALLVAEARGLDLLAPHIRVPRVLANGCAADGTSWLALEWLDLLPLVAPAWTDLGRQLASLHAVTAPCHGLDHDNFIGTTPQTNLTTSGWREFYLERRLRPQIQLARSRGHDLPEAGILESAGEF